MISSSNSELSHTLCPAGGPTFPAAAPWEQTPDRALTSHFYLPFVDSGHSISDIG